VGSGRYSIPPEGYGAVEKHIWNLASAIKKKGHEVHIINSVMASNSIGEYKFALKSIKEVKKIDYDVLHIHTAPVGLVYSLFGYDMVYTSHSRHWNGVKSLRELYGLMVEKHNVKHAKKVVALTEVIKKKMGINRNVVVIPNGVDTSLYKNSNMKKNRIVMMGEVSPRKEFHLALLALKDLNYNVTIIGPVTDRDYADRLRCIMPSVVLTGEIEEMKMTGELSSSTIFIHPSRSEGLSMAVIEAMASGMAVIASSVNSIVEDGKSGYLFDSSLDDAGITSFIRDKTTMLINNNELAARLGQYGRAIIERSYSWEVIADKMIELYTSFLAM
jgi:glycosyltransferase involved in cell wall biosynthesis